MHLSKIKPALELISAVICVGNELSDGIEVDNRVAIVPLERVVHECIVWCLVVLFAPRNSINKRDPTVSLPYFCVFGKFFAFIANMVFLTSLEIMQNMSNANCGMVACHSVVPFFRLQV